MTAGFAVPYSCLYMPLTVMSICIVTYARWAVILPPQKDESIQLVLPLQLIRDGQTPIIVWQRSLPVVMRDSKRQVRGGRAIGLYRRSRMEHLPAILVVDKLEVKEVDLGVGTTLLQDSRRVILHVFKQV
eukprot:752278-Hanusia_phi.AAC.3